MSFVAGLLLMYLPEEAAYGGLTLLMRDRGLRKYYSTDMCAARCVLCCAACCAACCAVLCCVLCAVCCVASCCARKQKKTP